MLIYFQINQLYKITQEQIADQWFNSVNCQHKIQISFHLLFATEVRCS